MIYLIILKIESYVCTYIYINNIIYIYYNIYIYIYIHIQLLSAYLTWPWKMAQLWMISHLNLDVWWIFHGYVKSPDGRYDVCY